MNKDFKVRFSLAKCSYKLWKVDDRFYDPSEISLILYKCHLVNNPRKAKRIFLGENKDVCAWVKCKRVEVVYPLVDIPGPCVHYDPKIAPYWVIDGENADGAKINKLVSVGNQLYRAS